jgi:polysaccharide pyruvyl transferase WcaK-like protein
MNVFVFDPGVMNGPNGVSSNLGDLIIREAVLNELGDVFGDATTTCVSSHEWLPASAVASLRSADLVFVGGTNLLSSNMNRYRQWKINLRSAVRIRRAVLLGVGWWQYQKPANLYTRCLLWTALSGKYLHSVRDEYTKEKLKQAGIHNVLNTGCPTMWRLTPALLSKIPITKADTALCATTDYNKNPALDLAFLTAVGRLYKRVFIWPQGSQDTEYLSELRVRAEILPHSYDALLQFLNSDVHFDYIGTRLHAGIRCLNAGKRSLVIIVDNRGREISRDTGLHCVERGDLNALEQWVRVPMPVVLKLNTQAIEKWKSQFSGMVSEPEGLKVSV